MRSCDFDFRVAALAGDEPSLRRTLPTLLKHLNELYSGDDVLFTQFLRRTFDRALKADQPAVFRVACDPEIITLIQSVFKTVSPRDMVKKEDYFARSLFVVMDSTREAPARGRRSLNVTRALVVLGVVEAFKPVILPKSEDFPPLIPKITS